MKKQLILLVFGILIIFISCGKKQEKATAKNTNWQGKVLSTPLPDSLMSGSSYLSVYSQIYSETEHLTHDLTATVSLRNTSSKDTVYILKADYFNTEGDYIRPYITQPIFLKPLETLAIVIEEKDQEGGTGANFIFDWRFKKNTSEPLFEAVMISTSGSQGLSFTTQGRRIE